MARVYADVNQNMPRSYWDYDSVNISECLSCPLFCAVPGGEVPVRAGCLGPPPREHDWSALGHTKIDPVLLGWGVLENYEVVRKIGKLPNRPTPDPEINIRTRDATPLNPEPCARLVRPSIRSRVKADGKKCRTGQILRGV